MDWIAIDKLFLLSLLVCSQWSFHWLQIYFWRLLPILLEFIQSSLSFIHFIDDTYCLKVKAKSNFALKNCCTFDVKTVSNRRTSNYKIDYLSYRRFFSFQDELNEFERSNEQPRKGIKNLVKISINLYSHKGGSIIPP